MFVRVNAELVLDVGWSELVATKAGREQYLRPPATSQFDQILKYLDAMPDPPVRSGPPLADLEGVAAAALVLRWGSYLAVLLDLDKPLWSEARSKTASRIADQEMARINIEASAALAKWIEVYRSRGASEYQRLVRRAVAYLPMPLRRAKGAVSAFGALAEPALASACVALADPPRLNRVTDQVQRYPSRVFANALINTAWRNGPVEDVHAGEGEEYPLDRRRVAPSEERRLMRFASEGLAFGMAVCRDLAADPDRWAAKVLPYGLAELLGVTPSEWSLTETSREVRRSA